MEIFAQIACTSTLHQDINMILLSKIVYSHQQYCCTFFSANCVSQKWRTICTARCSTHEESHKTEHFPSMVMGFSITYASSAPTVPCKVIFLLEFFTATEIFLSKDSKIEASISPKAKMQS